MMNITDVIALLTRAAIYLALLGITVGIGYAILEPLLTEAWAGVAGQADAIIHDATGGLDLLHAVNV